MKGENKGNKYFLHPYQNSLHSQLHEVVNTFLCLMCFHLYQFYVNYCAPIWHHLSLLFLVLLEKSQKKKGKKSNAMIWNYEPSSLTSWMQRKWPRFLYFPTMQIFVIWEQDTIWVLAKSSWLSWFCIFSPLVNREYATHSFLRMYISFLYIRTHRTRYNTSNSKD